MGTRPRFKGQPPVDAYGNGGFRLGDQRFEGSVIVTPLGLYPWSPKSVEQITPVSLAPIIEAAGHFDFVIIGLGEQTVRLPADAQRRLESQAIFPDAMATGPACRTYNMMLSENRRVAAAFIAVV